MRSYLNIKGKYIWRMCALVLLGVVFAYCDFNMGTIAGPAEAVANTSVTFDVPVTVNSNEDQSASIIFGVLVPTGWNIREGNRVKVQYSGTPINGTQTMSLLPASSPNVNGDASVQGLTWSQAFRKKFGLEGNFLDDMEWVIFKTDVINYKNQQESGHIFVTLTVGADNNDAELNLGFAYTEDRHGLKIDNDNKTGYYAHKPKFFKVTGGSNGEFIDYANPRLASIDPYKSSTNDLLTFSFNKNVAINDLTTSNDIYMHAEARDANGAVIEAVSTKNVKLIQTTNISGIYKKSIWPKSFFKPSATPIASIVFYMTDKENPGDAGAKKVGSNKPGEPFADFTFKFNCK
jgi:hypothetical protein